MTTKGQSIILSFFFVGIFTDLFLIYELEIFNILEDKLYVMCLNKYNFFFDNCIFNVQASLGTTNNGTTVS